MIGTTVRVCDYDQIVVVTQRVPGGGDFGLVERFAAALTRAPLFQFVY